MNQQVDVGGGEMKKGIEDIAAEFANGPAGIAASPEMDAAISIITRLLVELDVRFNQINALDAEVRRLRQAKQ